MRDAIKFWRPDAVQTILTRLAGELKAPLDEFLNNKTTLVPAPRSTPLISGALNPPYLIADGLTRLQLGKEVVPLLTRTKAARKAAFAPPGSRPTIAEHLDTMIVRPTLISGEAITVVDDFVTKGSTLFATVTRVAEAFPGIPVRAFALVRTLGLIPDIERIVEPVSGIIRNVEGEGNRQP